MEEGIVPLRESVMKGDALILSERVSMSDSISSLGKVLIIVGIVIVIIGIIFSFSGKIPFVGKMPGDILIRKGNFTFYFPIVTSIVLSILLTLIFWLINKFRS